MSRDVRHRLRGHRRQQPGPLLACVAGVLLLGGCGGSDGAGSAELCANYDEIVATAEDFSQLDPTETSADELRTTAKDFRAKIDELQEVAEAERIDTALSNLEASLDSARDALANAGDQAEEKRAQAEDSVQEINEKWARVQALVTDRCN